MALARLEAPDIMLKLFRPDDDLMRFLQTRNFAKRAARLSTKRTAMPGGRDYV